MLRFGLASLLLASLLFGAPFVGTAAAQDCSAEALAEAYGPVREQYDGLLADKEASVSWSSDEERSLRRLADDCAGKIGRRAGFYVAIVDLIRGELDASSRRVRDLQDESGLSESEQRQLEELESLVSSARSEADREARREAEARASQDTDRERAAVRATAQRRSGGSSAQLRQRRIAGAAMAGGGGLVAILGFAVNGATYQQYYTPETDRETYEQARSQVAGALVVGVLGTAVALSGVVMIVVPAKASGRAQVLPGRARPSLVVAPGPHTKLELRF